MNHSKYLSDQNMSFVLSKHTGELPSPEIFGWDDIKPVKLVLPDASIRPTSPLQSCRRSQSRVSQQFICIDSHDRYRSSYPDSLSRSTL